MYWSTSNRPGLSRAPSMRSGLFVAPTIKIGPCAWMPSSSARNWLTTLSITPPESPPLPLAGAKESNSSKNRMHGAAPLAFANTSLTLRSLSPTYMLISSGPFTLRKFILNSVAIALARSVFPVPGGPYKSTPDLLFRPLLKRWGYLSGVSMVAMMAFFASSRPPTSPHCTDGTFGAPRVFAILSFVILIAASKQLLGLFCPSRSERAKDLDTTALMSLAFRPTVSKLSPSTPSTPGRAPRSFPTSLETEHSTSCENRLRKPAGKSSTDSVVTITMMFPRAPRGFGNPFPASFSNFLSLSLPLTMCSERQENNSLSFSVWWGICEKAWPFLKSKTQGENSLHFSNVALRTSTVFSSLDCMRSNVFRLMRCTPSAEATSLTQPALLHPEGPWRMIDVRGDLRSLQWK
mmetsp:Transcript_8871/g.25305  ORF Transcript_8871/g.25305 Transcript_8871/m.25305 type:complete len:406 (+) Transcript_8871:325-1542(+)